LALRLGSLPPGDPYRVLGLGLIALVCSAAGLRGAANVLDDRPDRGALQLVLAGGGCLLVGWLLLLVEPLGHYLVTGEALLPLGAGTLLLLAAVLTLGAPQPGPARTGDDG